MGPDGEPGLSADPGTVERVDLADGPVAVRTWGASDGRPLVFLHGLGPVNSSALLALSVGPLVDAGFRVLGIDAPGFGASARRSAGAYEPEALGGLVWSVLDALGVDRTVLLGHSWGGVVACYAAAAEPGRVAALVIADAGHRDPGEPLDVPLEDIVRGAEGVRMRAADRAAVARELEVATDDPFVDAVLAALVDDGSGGLVSSVTADDLANARYRTMRARPSGTWPTIAEAGIPTLALLATVPEPAGADNRRDAVPFAEAVPEADVVHVEGASHQMITDLRDRFGQLVADWLASLVPPVPR